MKTHWIPVSIALRLLSIERNGFLVKKLNYKTVNFLYYNIKILPKSQQEMQSHKSTNVP